MAEKTTIVADEIQEAIPIMPDISSVSDVFQGMSDFAPIIITGFLFMSSMFNHDIKAFVWIGPAIFWMLLLRLMQPKIGKPINKATCKQSKWLGEYQNPSLSSFLIMYTLGYIAAPMPIYNDWNIIAIASFLILFGVDAVVKMKSECCNTWGIVNGGFFGLFMGAVMYFVLRVSGMEKVLYYTTGDSNRVYCSKPKEQNFKCNVYKNGNIISSL
jgi:hypothetical protein